MNNEVEAYPGELRELRVRVRVLGDHMRACDRDAADIEIGTVTIVEGIGDHPAKYTVFWPGQTVHVCQQHFDWLNHVSAAMCAGAFDLGFREEAGNQCQNCVNEAKKDSQCEHGRNPEEYCQPCGRIHGGSG